MTTFETPQPVHLTPRARGDSVPYEWSESKEYATLVSPPAMRMCIAYRPAHMAAGIVSAEIIGPYQSRALRSRFQVFPNNENVWPCFAGTENLDHVAMSI